MQIFYAHIDETNNRILGWYTSEVHGDNIPTPNIEVTRDRWQEILDNNHTVLYNDGTSEYVNFFQSE